MKSKILGIGVNDVDYQVYIGKRSTCPFYSTWKNMLTRHVTKGTQVVETWLTFSNFKSWMQTQDWEGNELDKDLLGDGSTGYSPDTCCFIPRAVNSFLQDKRKTTTTLPLGVSRTRSGSFKAYAGANGIGHYLGTFISPELAHEAWREFKYNHSNILADDLQRMGFSSRVCDRLRSKYKESAL